MAKRIVIVTDSWNEQINGVSTTYRHTVGQLRSKGFDPHVIDSSQFRTFSCPTYPDIPLSWDIWKMGQIIKRLDPDYLHIGTEGPLGFAAKIWADRRRLRYSTGYHTQFPAYIEKYFGGGLKMAFRAMRMFHGRASAVMVNTQSMADLLAANGFDRKKLRIWGRGVDTDLFRPDGAVPDLFKSLPRPVMLNVGRVAVEKNLPAFYAIPGTKVQVGGGPMLAEYQRSHPGVVFVGPKTGQELASYYRAADVFVFPSMSDTYGLVMLESIASGVPVAAYPVAGPQDVLVPEVGAMCTDLAAAVQAALAIDRGPLRAWAVDKSWSACTDDFISYLTPVREPHGNASVSGARSLTSPRNACRRSSHPWMP